ncbi:hypothetical protein [Natrialba asiatica]|nr:hypothetical protein [Natrialba asiatica]
MTLVDTALPGDFPAAIRSRRVTGTVVVHAELGGLRWNPGDGPDQ